MKSRLRSFVSLALALVLVLGAFVPAHAASNSHIEVAGQSVKDGGTLAVGDEMTVAVGIKAVSLSALTGGLHFDTEKLKCTDIEIIDEGGNGDPMAISSVSDSNNNGNIGFVYLATSNKNYKGGTVFSATFKAIAEPLR